MHTYKLPNKTNVRFCDLTVGTEFYFCDPETVSDKVKLERFKKISPPPSWPARFGAIAGLENLTTGENRGLSARSIVFQFPVWPQEPTPEPKKIEGILTDLVGKVVSYRTRSYRVNSVWLDNGQPCVAMSPAYAKGPVVIDSLTKICV